MALPGIGIMTNTESRMDVEYYRLSRGKKQLKMNFLFRKDSWTFYSFIFNPNDERYVVEHLRGRIQETKCRI